MTRPVHMRLLGAPGDVAAILVRLRAAGLEPAAPAQRPARTPGSVLAYTTIHIRQEDQR